MSRLKAGSRAACIVNEDWNYPSQAQSETIKWSIVKFRVHLGAQAAVYSDLRLSFRREVAIDRYRMERVTGHRCVLR
ncbi:hypothetical protein BO83DRAFT_458687 [Aspergillus eucalypticola CBS 122712]|uniref:Uncharacterized protein n=1 Tax=Aspergillus eucalypticola (strain CBS 122712 / IBT 29274) TaxID=1448314 RepID=A0A317UQV5_ASPEC|nr:uncharacterized protein BO83DRAFT_458687 [Aspergillus eucalypticola CBS 122712]PWY62420.1 hypothetical protein BO83DRAFT_458687 [Aspergillus eucalypticola CBS 122712]